MANDRASQSRKTAVWNGRAVIVLQEMDGDEYHFHGVMLGPEGMETERALLELDVAFVRGKFKGGDDWNYDDVLEEMQAAGFEEVLAVEWWEPQ